MCVVSVRMEVRGLGCVWEVGAGGGRRPEFRPSLVFDSSWVPLLPLLFWLGFASMTKGEHHILLGRIFHSLHSYILRVVFARRFARKRQQTFLPAGSDSPSPALSDLNASFPSFLFLIASPISWVMFRLGLAG